jgi:thiamine pyrophosphokinase
VLTDLPPDAFVVAADSGLDHALTVGLRPNLVVGDLDSVSSGALEIARAEGITIEEYSPDKDATDTELALAAALAWGPDHVILLAGGGDRLDHSIAAITALGHASLAQCASVTARWGTSHIHVLHGPRSLTVRTQSNTTFSLLALHGTCAGVVVKGAKWPLDNAVLAPASSLGISNITLAGELHVELTAGVLTLIFPYQYGGQQ